MYIPLSEAIERLNSIPGTLQSSYERYRRDAAGYGRINFGGHQMPVVKQGRRWMVEESDVEKGLALERQTQETLAQMTEDYRQRIVHPGRVDIAGGGYRAGTKFHFVWDHIVIARMKSDGFWRCNTCWTPADVERKGEECHRCRDWGSCGGECTTTNISCSFCNISVPVGQASRSSLDLEASN